MATHPIDQPLPPPVNRTKGRVTVETGSIPAGAVRESAGARQAARNELSAPEFNALGPSHRPGRTIDEDREYEELPPVGSKDYVAGQPVDAEEQARTESLAAARDRAAGPDLVTPEGIKKAREQEEGEI